MTYRRTQVHGVARYESADGRVVIYVGRDTPAPRRITQGWMPRVIRYKPRRSYRVRVDGKALPYPFWTLADAKGAAEEAVA